LACSTRTRTSFTEGSRGEYGGDSLSTVRLPSVLGLPHRLWSERPVCHECMARIVPDNPLAFPPSMEVRWRRYEPATAMEGGRYESTDGRGRDASGTKTENNAGRSCRDGGDTSLRMGEVGRSRKPEPRAKQDARAEEWRWRAPFPNEEFLKGEAVALPL